MYTSYYRIHRIPPSTLGQKDRGGRERFATSKGSTLVYFKGEMNKYFNYEKKSTILLFTGFETDVMKLAGDRQSQVLINKE